MRDADGRLCRTGRPVTHKPLQAWQTCSACMRQLGCDPCLLYLGLEGRYLPGKASRCALSFRQAIS